MINGNEISFKVRAFDSKQAAGHRSGTLIFNFLRRPAVTITLSVSPSIRRETPTLRVSLIAVDFPTTPGAFKTTSDFGESHLSASSIRPVVTSFTRPISAVPISAIQLARAIAVIQREMLTSPVAHRKLTFRLLTALRPARNFFKTTDSAANWNNNNTGLVW